ncbi:hypothetical protein BpHYR1_001555 [Brachionus plicatilis]|uniref:Uncharacterized protein n=1 Tax=Brachionus plicatilis TaxID=10195 RepID=A0A3M7Q9S4_BRAPC|nr:hypothetical protein BpHYR1_001555 [Brachionus plicatilis]
MLTLETPSWRRRIRRLASCLIRSISSLLACSSLHSSLTRPPVGEHGSGWKAPAFLSADSITTCLFELSTVAVVVSMVEAGWAEESGRRRLAECGKSNMAEVRRFWAELSGDMVVQQAILN